MMGMKIILIILFLLIYAQTLYISKQPIPTLFLNQQFKFNITNNAPQYLSFNLVSGPSFVTLTKNGHINLLPKNQGSFQIFIKCFNTTTNAELFTLSYVLNVIDKKKQTGNLWILDRDQYSGNGNSNLLSIKVNNFNFDQAIMTNENIRLQLTTVNSVKTVTWFYQNLPQTITGGKNNGIISGYVENEGNYMIKCTAIDSQFRQAQIFIFLKFKKMSVSLQTDSYSEYSWKNAFIMQEKKQNGLFMEKQLNTLFSKNNQLKLQRSQIINSYRSIDLSRQQSKSNQAATFLKISQKNQDLKEQNFQLQKLQNDLISQKSKVQQARKLLNEKISIYNNNMQKAKSKNATKQTLLSQAKDIKNQFQALKKDISLLEAQIFKNQNELRDIQYERSRSNVSYVTYQKQQVRTREILQIRKNIQFQYLIKKAQTDNKARRNQDFVFLSQSNYDFALSEYKQQSLLYLKYQIQSTYLQGLIDGALKEYDDMKKLLNKLQISYEIALGQVNTLKVTQNQLSKLSTYAINNAIANATAVKNLNETQMIQLEAKAQVKEYPFTGCQLVGNFAWAGSGKIKLIGKNSLTLSSQETVNFGACTEMKTHSLQIGQLAVGQWIQFSGYYWDGAVQATKITLLQVK